MASQDREERELAAQALTAITATGEDTELVPVYRDSAEPPVKVLDSKHRK